MVSRRNFISIVLMMAVLFFMFQFAQIIKDSRSNYDVNEYASDDEKMPDGSERWQQDNVDIIEAEKSYVLYITSRDDALTDIVAQWCTYSKRNLLKVKELAEAGKNERLPEVILLNTDGLQLENSEKELKDLVKLGVPVIFCNLPDVKQIQASDTLQAVLGIREVRASETKAEGIHLFEGFFLGGEVIYKPETEEEQKRQDMEINIPWYITDSGTKTYMVGIKEKEAEKKEEYPALIWRNDYQGTKVFAVCGEYMSTLAGLGILDTFLYELNSYELYPVVNAQNIFVSNFPGFSAENEEMLMRVYSRSAKAAFRDIMWPSISAMVESNDLRLTCFMNPQYDYTDGIEPEGEEVDFYLQQLKLLDSEAGMSIKYKDNASLSQVLQADGAFYDAQTGNYKYRAVFANQRDLAEIKAQQSVDGMMQNVVTIVSEYEPGNPIIGYVNQRITLQNAISRAENYTYMEDMIARSVQTALGYSGVVLDLHTAIWPEQVEDQWQHLYDEMSSNIHTYWATDKGFDRTTVSESDIRVRNFLNLDYTKRREENTITLCVNGFLEEASFLLRTHEDKIVNIQGADYEQIEQNVYLLRIYDEKVTIELEQMSLSEQGAKVW